MTWLLRGLLLRFLFLWIGCQMSAWMETVGLPWTCTQQNLFDNA